MATATHPPSSLDHHAGDAIRALSAELALEGYTGPGPGADRSSPAFAALQDTGSELWLDTGDAQAIEPLWCREMTALTTNNTLVNQVIQRGGLDEAMGRASRRLNDAKGLSEAERIFELGFVANARVALSLVQRFGARVSVELHPAMADDIEASLLFARRYYALCPERFFIKVPLQPAGFLVVRQLEAEGIPVNYTLGFSARQNYLATLFSRPHYVNVFLGRLNAVVEDNHLGSPVNVGEKTTLSSREGVHEVRLSDPDISTKQIAASVRNAEQVRDLAGVDVYTIPPKAAEAFEKMGLRRDDLKLHDSRDLKVDLADTPWRTQVEGLWIVDDEFREAAAALAAEDTRAWNGREFADHLKRRNVSLFHDWTEDETATLKQDGKIPKVEKWEGVPLDDLMTQSALQSFAVDQKALDDHLAELAAKG